MFDEHSSNLILACAVPQLGWLNWGHLKCVTPYEVRVVSED